MGIEPTLAAWEAAVLPLNYTRDACRDFKPSRATFHARAGGRPTAIAGSRHADEAPAMRTASHSADVAIAGAGIAGITAAVEALDRGRRVILVDRDLQENLGGLARESFGGIW